MILLAALLAASALPIADADQAGVASDVAYDLMVARICGAPVDPAVERGFAVWGASRSALDGSRDARAEAGADAIRRIQRLDQSEMCAGSDVVAAHAATRWRDLLELSVGQPEVLPSGRTLRPDE